MYYVLPIVAAAILLIGVIGFLTKPAPTPCRPEFVKIQTLDGQACVLGYVP